MKRIAFQTYMGEEWLAGSTATVGLLQALQTLGPEAPEVDLVVWTGTAPASYAPALPYISQVLSIPYSVPAKAAPARTPLQRWLGQPAAAPPAQPRRSKILLERGVVCTFSTIWSERLDFGIPTVIWLPDFQHRRLPEMFSASQRSERDALYLKEIEAATLVVVTAEDVGHDLAAFAPQHAEKARLLPLVPVIPPEVYQQDPAAKLAEYHLPERFILLPNQFWKHKNHELVLAALSRLRKQGVTPTIVCTGNPYDSRHPEYFAALLAHISRLNLREQFILLGIVPRLDVLGLMRQAVGVLNASLFEGFGLSLSESKFLGKQALVSDLAAHREQAAPDTLYFDPLQADDLADKLAQMWRSNSAGPDLPREVAARAALSLQFASVGRTFAAILAEAVARWQTAPA
ncbi:MAG: glycosyltransferase [Anaerolineales bacterium]